MIDDKTMDLLQERVIKLEARTDRHGDALMQLEAAGKIELSSGEVLDIRNGLTQAQVMNLMLDDVAQRNGKVCVVRINDRGPFVKGRIIDVSRAAAKKHGFISSGVTKVKCERIA